MRGVRLAHPRALRVQETELDRTPRVLTYEEFSSSGDENQIPHKDTPCPQLGVPPKDHEETLVPE